MNGEPGGDDPTAGHSNTPITPPEVEVVDETKYVSLLLIYFNCAYLQTDTLISTVIYHHVYLHVHVKKHLSVMKTICLMYIRLYRISNILYIRVFVI